LNASHGIGDCQFTAPAPIRWTNASSDHPTIQPEVLSAEGVIRRVFRDVQFDKNDGVIYAACDAPLAHASFREEPLIGRIKATRGGNRETVATFEVRPT